MARAKSPRVLITLECAECRHNLKKRSHGVSRYLTTKNKRNTANKLEAFKYCKYCNAHTAHKEIK